MKFYRCDMCNEEFHFLDGIVKGLYNKELKRVRFSERDHYPPHYVLKTHEFKVRKTLRIYDVKRSTAEYPAGEETPVEKDLCAKCIKNLEKP